MINQIEAAYEDPESNDIVAVDNSEVKDIYDTIMSHTDLSAGLQQWNEDWVNSFQNNGFA